MKYRYISEFDTSEIPEEDFDVIVIGSGIAGSTAALKIDPKYKIVLITKKKLDESNSSLAQGGIAACVDPKDDFISHYKDTLKAGAYHNREETTKILIKEAPSNIRQLLTYGTKLDRDEQGNLRVTREGGHSKRRIVHAKDATGREVIRALHQELETRTNITVKEDVFAIDILTCNGTACGVIALDPNGKLVFYKGKAVIIASGGIGQIYKNSTNPTVATGDGIAMAYRAGACVKDMEFIQFHPTALYDGKPGQKFLISEAVRGEGAILRNSKGEIFMGKYHEMKDLAPRDIVARSIFEEMKKTGSPCVFLDITHKSSQFIVKRFPNIYKRCLAEGVDMTKDWIPVAPAEHYIMGGIDTDINGHTNLQGVYACGECACTGVHGANRLASNSLLEGLVFGNRVADSINHSIAYVHAIELCKKIVKPKNGNESAINIDALRMQLQDIMNRYASIMRSEEGLQEAKIKVEKIKNDLWLYCKNHISYLELMNMCTVAILIIKGALNRKESLGAHYRVEKMEE